MSIGDLIEKFRAVALDRVEKMNVLLVELEREAHEASIEELTREIHTLKGEAKMMGFADVNLVSHLTEHLMLDAAALGFDVDSDHTELMFEGLDVLRALLTKAAGGASAPIDLAGFVDRVAQARGAQSSVASEQARTPRRPAAAPADGAKGDRRKADGSLLHIQASGSARVDLAKLERLGEVSGEILLSSRRLDFQLGELERLRARYLELRTTMETVLPKSLASRARGIGHQLDAILSELRSHVAQAAAWGSQLDAQTRELRHVSLEETLQHYPRAVRDLAASQGKKVRLDQDLAGVEVDRLVLNGLADPLLHLVRNAVDHGIEPPDERERAGKPREGTVRLAAEHAGDSVRVILSDDGRGIDPMLIGRKAVERGLVSGMQVAAMSPDEVLGLIFEPGFSTRDEITDVSGRGIGMDVVRRQVGSIGGSVEIESDVGHGTTFTLVVPVSSAVGAILTFIVDHRHFAITAKDVERVEFVEFEELEHVGNSLRVRWDENLVVPLLDWRRVITDFERDIPRGRLTVLSVGRGSRRIALWVDDVIGERDGLTRPLGEFLSGLHLCRGVAITDAGEVVPLLNVNELLNSEAAPAEHGRVRATMELSRAPRLQRVLVVEDSEITRTLVSGILRNLGYHVVEAEDGAYGWDVLNEQRVDLVLSDVQMPRMSGLDLLEKIRADVRFQKLPVIILTTLGEAADKERALRLGADAYLVKLNFQEKELIRTVRRFLEP